MERFSEQVHRCQQYGIGSCNGKGWHVYTYHEATGILWAEEYRPKFATKAEAMSAAKYYATAEIKP